MHRGHRGIDNSALALVVLALVVIFSIIGFYLGQDDGRSRAAQVSAQKHHEDTAAQIETYCAGLSIPTLTECIEKAVETSGDHQRAEYDLAAQQDVAEWTKWVLVVSVVGVLLTLVGIYFVWLTFGETRETNLITKDIGQAQSRAYVHVEAVKLSWGNFQATRPQIILSVVNTGQTPARWFEVSTKSFIRELDDTGLDTEALSFKDIKIPATFNRWNALGAGASLTAGGLRREDIETIRESYGRKTSSLNVAGTLKYETFFGEIFETEFWFRARPIPEFRLETTTPHASGLAVRGVPEKPHALQRVMTTLSSYKQVHDE